MLARKRGIHEADLNNLNRRVIHVSVLLGNPFFVFVAFGDLFRFDATLDVVRLVDSLSFECRMEPT